MAKRDFFTALFVLGSLAAVGAGRSEPAASAELESCKAEVRTMWTSTLDKLPGILERQMQAHHEEMMRETTDLHERVWKQFGYELSKKIAEPFLSPEFWHAVVLPKMEKKLNSLTYARECVRFKAHQEKELSKFIKEIAKL